MRKHFSASIIILAFSFLSLMLPSCSKKSDFKLPKELPVPAESAQKTGGQPKIIRSKKGCNFDKKLFENANQCFLGTSIPASKSSKSFCPPAGSYQTAIVDFDHLAILLGEYRKTRSKPLKEQYLKEISELLKLSDPVWGGFYTIPGTGRGPNHEKGLLANALGVVALLDAFSVTNDKKHLEAAEKNLGYMMNFLATPDGDFFAGQLDPMAVKLKDYYSLSDKDRRKLGMPPRVKDSEHGYPTGNSFAVITLLRAYEKTGKPEYLSKATASLDVLKDRARTCAGDNDPSCSLFLRSIILSFIEAYETTGETEHLKHAENFAGKPFSSTDSEYSALLLAGALDKLYFITGNSKYHDRAEEYLNGLSCAYRQGKLTRPAKYVLAAQNHFSHPLVVSVIGSRKDPATARLRLAARRFFEPRKVVMTLDPRTDPKRLAQLPYGAPTKPTLFACVETACSLPVTDPDDVEKQLSRFVDRHLYGIVGGPMKGKLTF